MAVNSILGFLSGLESSIAGHSRSGDKDFFEDFVDAMGPFKNKVTTQYDWLKGQIDSFYEETGDSARDFGAAAGALQISL